MAQIVGVPAPWGLEEGPKGQISLNFNYTQRKGKVTRKSHTLNIGQYLVHSERRSADTSTFNVMA